MFEVFALVVAANLDGGNSRLSNLVNRVGSALQFIENKVVVILKSAVGEVNDVLLSDFGENVNLVANLAPVAVLDEGIGHLNGTATIALGLLHDGEFLVVDGGLQQAFVEFALLDEFNLLEKQLLELLQRLTLIGTATENEHAVVVESVDTAVGTEAFLRLVEVHVDKAAFAVVKNSVNEVGNHTLAAANLGSDTVGDSGVFGVVAGDVLRFGLGDGSLFGEGELRHVARLHVAPVFVDNLDYLVGVEVASHAYTDVVGHIIFGVELANIAHGGIFEVFGLADGGLKAIGMMRKHGTENLLVAATAVLGEAHVFLFIDGFEFGVEEAQHEVLETVGLQLAPSLNLVGRDILDIHRTVVAGESIGACGSDVGHHLVVLVGDGNLRSLVGKAVDAVVEDGTGGAIVKHTIDLEKVLNLLDILLFLLPVGGAEAMGAFEHHVLQIVCQTSGFGGVVLAASAHCHIGLNTRRLLIDAQKDLQTVVERVFAHLERVIGIGLVLVGLLGHYAARHEDRQGHKAQNLSDFHIVKFLFCIFMKYAKIVFFRQRPTDIGNTLSPSFQPSHFEKLWRYKKNVY